MKNLLEDEARAEVRTRLMALTPADARRWGVLTVEEMMAHLRQAYLATTSGGEAAMIAGPLPPRVMKFLALSVPVKWPRGIPTVPSLERTAMPAPDSFAEEQERLLAAFERFCGCTANTTRHAIFGAMRPADWMRWGYLHADHHLRQFGR